MFGFFINIAISQEIKGGQNMANYKETAKEVVKLTGGKGNITNAWHCVTRLRFNLKDKNIPDLEKIKKVPGVMGAQFSGDQFQVIIGNTVVDVFEEVEELLGGTGTGEASSNEKEGIISKLMDGISGVFTPIIPALAGTGLLKGFLALAVLTGILDTTSGLYQILNNLSDSVFYFMPFFLAVSSARKFKTSEYLALAVAGTMMYPTFLDIAKTAFMDPSVVNMTIFEVIPIPYVNYSNSVIPIIFSVILLKHVHKWVRSWMPKSLSLMFTPMITLVIVIPVALTVLGPIGSYAGEYVGKGMTWLFDTIGPLGGVVLGATFPLLVMTGMHYSLVPIALSNRAVLGYENMVGPVNGCTNIAQAGAAFGVAVRTKNKEMRQVAISSGISALLGITEPAMYGVNVKLKRPFYYSLAGGAIAAGAAIFFNCRSFGGGGMPGLMSLPAYVHVEDSMNVVWMAVCLAIAFFSTFILTITLGFQEDAAEEVIAEAAEKKAIKNGTKHRVFAPISGKLQLLSSVDDNTFASELVGKGIAIQPDNGEVVAPISGVVSVLPDTQHAIGIVGDDGVEILVHIGIDTVKLNGKHFDFKVNKGDHIEKGQLLGTFDFEGITAAGLDPITMVVVTNSSDFVEIMNANDEGIIFKEEELLIVL